MANPPRPQMSSIFDDMLAETKTRFDDLFRSGRSPGGALATSPAALSGAVGATSSAAVAHVRPDWESPAAERLNARYGDGWRYEIVERRRDGDEAIVLCKLILKGGAVRSQFGSATISAAPVAGASGNLKFRIGETPGGQTEREAFRRATEAALMNCADLA
jgi:hypothetical protein